jgi:hypothetical protein
VHNAAVSTVRAGRGPVSGRQTVSRRGILRGLLAVAGATAVGAGSTTALAGCDVFTGGDGGDEAHELDAFLLGTVALGDLYDATLAAQPSAATTLTPLRETHRAHARALADALGKPVPSAPASVGPAPADRAQALAALATAEKTGRDAAVTACMAAAPRLAALLGSIAAARATHLEVLT